MLSVVSKTDRDEDDKSNGVEVLEQVIGYTVQCHVGSHGHQVSRDLIVRDPVELFQKVV